MKQIDFSKMSQAEFKNFMIERFTEARNEFQRFLEVPMLIACNSVVVVNNDNNMTIGVDTKKHTTKLNRGFDFPCTFTPNKAREIAAMDIVKDGDGKVLPLRVKNIGTYCREQIAALDNLLATLNA